MAEIEEPPAKVLKIDHIDGVTHITEMQHMPEDAEVLLEEHEILGEESGIIEGGADGPDHGQEEWLSEGILTDDDYNPASQGDAEDRTDSQLGSSHDEDQQNDSIERLDTTASESNVADIEANIAEMEDSTVESASNMQTDADVAESEANVPGKTTNIPEGHANVIQTDEHLVQLANIGNEDVAESQSYMEPQTFEMEIDTNVTANTANITENGAKVNSDTIKTEVKTAELNIEETMEHLDGAKENSKPDIFDSLLIKKNDIKAESKNIKTETKQEQDDGNDTDDLLRMLGEDDSKTKKKLTKTVKDIRAAKPRRGSSDDDDFVFEGTTVKKLKVAKTALAKKQPAIKAEPEDLGDGDDETEVSADEASTMKKMFTVKPKPNILTKQRPPPKHTSTPNVVVKRPPGKNIVNVVERPVHTQAKSQTATPLRQYQNKQLAKTSVLKPSPKSVAAAKAPTPKSLEAAKPFYSNFKPPEVQTPAPFKPALKPAARQPGAKPQPDETAHDEELLDEDHFDMDEDEFADSDFDVLRRQRIMRPEMMDEDVPSDGESHSEDGSLYDELPSSDSEDLEDWFQLDIRAEKAGDYIPLLGSRARELLLEEKRRVSSRLQSLKQSLTALTDSGKKQAEQLRDATMTLAELDDMLKAS